MKIASIKKTTYIEHNTKEIDNVDQYIDNSQIDELNNLRSCLKVEQLDGEYLVCHEKCKELRNDKITILDNISVMLHSYAKIRELVGWLGEDKIIAIQNNDFNLFNEYEMSCVIEIIQTLEYLKKMDEAIHFDSDKWDELKNEIIIEIESLIKKYDKVFVLKNKNTLN